MNRPSSQLSPTYLPILVFEKEQLFEFDFPATYSFYALSVLVMLLLTMLCSLYMHHAMSASFMLYVLVMFIILRNMQRSAKGQRINIVFLSSSFRWR